MLSRISKMSVFGIVALMLAFGLATTDALAQKGTVDVRVDTATFPAASEQTLTFTVDVTAEPTDPDAAGVVRISIPSVWSRPVNSDDAAVADIAVGEVFITEPADITGTVTGRNLVANIGKDTTNQITFAFKTITPHRMGTYTIPVTSSLHEGAAAITITIGTVAAGTGAYTVTRTNGSLYFQAPDDPQDLDPPYQGKYIAFSKDEFRNLVIRFTAPGTMPGNSRVSLTSVGFARFNVASDVILSGNADKSFSDDGLTVHATLKPSGLQKGGVITFSITSYNAPEVNPDPDNPAGAIEVGFTITVNTAIDPDGSADGSEPRDDGAEAPVGMVFDLITTKPAGTGKIVISRDGSPLTHIVAGTEFDIATPAATLSISFADFVGIGDGSKFEITVPDGWPQPLALLSGAAARDGGVANTNAGAAIEGRVLKGNLNNNAPNDTTAITYTVAKIPAAGSYTFTAKATAGPHTSLAPIVGHTIEVVVADATGSVALLTSGGAPVTQASPKAALGNLRFVFTPAGRMAKDAMVTIAVPTGWTAFREDNGDGQSDPGEVSVVGTKATMVVTTPTLITLTATETWTPADRITVNYRMVSVPDVAAATFTYQAQAKSHPGGTLADIGSPNIGIGRSPDGGGTLALSATQADAGSLIGNLTITYTAAGKMEAGSEVVVTIPPNGDWPAPSGLGRVELSAGTLSTTETTMTANTDVVLDGGDTIVFTYKAITAPVDGGTYTFTGKSKSSPTGTLTALGSGVTMTIDEVAAGAVALNGPEGALSSSAPGMALGNLTFVFTAGARMEVGSKVTVTIPVAWTPAFLDNNDGVDSPGESSLAGAADFVVSGGGGTPWVLTATTNAILESGDTLMFTYKQVTAPSTEATYQLTAMASTSAASKLLPVQSQPTIVVREPVTAIALTSDPSSVFTGGEIGLSVTLWAGTAAGRALGGVVIDLDDGDAGGTFTPAIITIGDAGHEGTATYTNATAGDYTITATAGDLEPVTVNVEVKSTIRDLSVNGETEMALLAQGSSIMVRATGPVGGGTVTILDSDGDKIGLKKALDPVGEPDADGDQIYSRSVDLPDVLADGMYTVSVEIQGDVNDSLSIQVVNDQDPPTLSNASVLPTTVANGTLLTLTVKATASSASNPVESVMADVSAVDSIQTDMLALTAQPGTDNTYFAIHTVSMDNTNTDGAADVTFTATDRIGNSSTATASVTLQNDVTAPELSDASAMPSPTGNGNMVTISVSSESGLTVMADASAIGGGAAVALTEGMMAADGNGMDANGNGNGMDANGNGNGDNGMTDTAMPAGNGVYSATVTVTDAADGEQTITITATDSSGNESSVDVTVTIDNTGAMLSDASADPSMATDGTEVTLSVNGSESGLTVMADASAIGGGAAVALTDDDGDNIYTASVMVTDAEDGEQMVMISGTDALGNIGEPVSVSVTVDNTAPTLSDASADPAEAVNGDMVTISVMGGESGLTVMADASELGAEADVELAESADTVGSYSGSVEVSVDSGGDKMVSITATDALGNASEAVTATVSVHEVTGVSFSPAQVSTGDSVTVTAMGTAGLTATFSVFDAEAMNIVDAKAMTESTDGGTYEGSFDIVVDAHPTGEYWVSASVGQASMTAEAALTIDHKAQFTLSIAAGTHAIHVPLDVTHIDGKAGTIETVGDLYDALGESVNFIITLGADGNWMSYLGDMSAGSMADAEIGDDTGLIAVMKSAATIELTGNALGTGGISQISIEIGNNLVGVPLNPAIDMMISGALVEGVAAIAVSNAAGDGFHTITEAGQDGDGPIMGGVGYIVVATAAANIPIVGSAWENEGAPMAAPAVAFSGSQTPVLHVDGGVMDEFDMLAQIPELRVTVRNLSTGASVDSVLGTDELAAAYSATFVEFGRHAAKVGDVLEIVAHSPNPYVGVRPVPQIVISAEEVLTSRISLPDLELYEIPSETELLANYPNPFNPETWIPYRLAQAAEVTLDIYDTTGRLVRTIDVGFKPAAVYESRASAIYWDGRNNYGERVASGTYFYHLTAGDDYASTRRMVILK